MANCDRLVALCVFLILYRLAEGQSVKGSRVKGGGGVTSSKGRWSQTSQTSGSCYTPSLNNGDVICDTRGDKMTCTGTCEFGLFKNGLAESEIVCSKQTGRWTPDRNFPECPSPYDRDYNQQSYQESSQTKQKTYETSSHQGLYNHGCPRLKAENHPNLKIECKTEYDMFVCIGTCMSGSFPDYSKRMRLECMKTGRWNPYDDFPQCSGGGGGYSSFSQGSSSSSSSSSSQHGSQSGHSSQQYESYIGTSGSSGGGYQGHGTHGSGGGYQGLARECIRPTKSPMNGKMSCQMTNGQWTCTATCLGGKEFPDRSTELTISCNNGQGIWTPRDSFDDCKAFCWPDCENGGTCANDNECLCPSKFRGNRCQYPTSLCDFRKLTLQNLNYNCSHASDGSTCFVSCMHGLQFAPSTSEMYRCTVDGRWNPPVVPECIKDDICGEPPGLMNGERRCTQSPDIMICTGTCRPGYMFESGVTETNIQCMKRTGDWSPSPNFPDCEPVCYPKCENGGKCIGNNLCLCSHDYRGPGCEYPISNCDPLERFSHVNRKCNHTQTESICTIGCDYGKLEPEHPTTYICTVDGVWQPDLQPACNGDYSSIDARKEGSSSSWSSWSSSSSGQSGGSSSSSWSSWSSGSSGQSGGSQFGGGSGSRSEWESGSGGNSQFQGGGSQSGWQSGSGGQSGFQGQSGGGSQSGGQSGFQGQSGGGSQSGGRSGFQGQSGGGFQSGGQSGFQGQSGSESQSGGRGRIDHGGYGQGSAQEEVIHKQTVTTGEGHGRTRQEQGKEELGVIITDDTETVIDAGGGDLFGTGLDEASKFNGICSVWGYYHYRAFNGRLYTYPSSCSYLLAADCVDDTVAISVKSSCTSEAGCQRLVGIRLGESRYYLSHFDGLKQDDIPLTIPTHVTGLTVERIARYLVARLSAGFTIWLDDENSLFIDALPIMENKTCGLCGNYDEDEDLAFVQRSGKIPQDIYEFVDSWKIDDLDGECVDTVEKTLPCNSETTESLRISNMASLTCEALKNMDLEECNELVDTMPYFRSCQMDCCSVGSAVNCECASMAEYYMECGRAGGDVSQGWRRGALCPLPCTNGTVYKQCGPACPPTCTNLEPSCKKEACIDGCFCPDGMVLDEGQCIPIESCPCIRGDKKYATGETMQQDCNTCICEGGEWKCTEAICSAMCTLSGPHLKTFDGLTYDLYAKCPHYLVDGDGFSVEVEYATKCREEIHPVCVKSIIIHTSEGAVVKMKTAMEVTVNGREMLKLPVLAPGAYVGQATSTFMRAHLSNDLEIHWDGHTSVYVHAPPELFKKLRGLCGTYTRQQHDDFLTPEGDIELTADVFTQKWAVEEACKNVPKVSEVLDEEPCDSHPKRRTVAARTCEVIHGPDFAECHELVDYEPFFARCMDDVCSCHTRPKLCSCLALSDYAAECARKGKPLFWRRSIPECGITCPLGQIYQPCANPCHYSCAEIAHSDTTCVNTCVEGCACSADQTTNELGHCVSVSSCSCVHSGYVYPPEFMQRRGREMCACAEGQWDCHEASTTDMLLTPPPHVASECLRSAHKEPTDCVSECPITCANLHHHQPCTVTICVAGCRCEKGYILDAKNDVCVLPKNCPCHHGGRSYEESAEVKMDCNTCKCEGGSWTCDSDPCPGICSAWGDSHYETYDGRMFDFVGECDYVMTKGRTADNAIYSVVIQTLPCGAAGAVSCGKTLIIALGESTVMLTQDYPVPEVDPDSRLSVSSLGMFTLVDSDIGISVQWDRNTRVYITAQPVWQGKVQGLCGDFNSDSSDDFKPPSKGLPLVNSKDFANSWKVHDYCKPAESAEDPCVDNPERRAWARQKCAVLKSDMFKMCHSEVEVDYYFKRCVFDACACSSGGDCQCVCAVIAAYAQKCARHDVVIPWRSQELCPVQCEECERYSPCISLCPAPNCDTYLDPPETHSCSREPCVDGCEPKLCPPGHVRQSATNITCVPESQCKVKPCIVIDGISYREGERIESESHGDACQSCYCRRGKVDCVGEPCPAVTTPPTVAPTLEECMTGWTDWINSNDPQDSDGEDIELLLLLESDKRLPCSVDQIKDVECRVVETQAPYDTTPQTVSCDKDDGLICRHQGTEEYCVDYEMRVYCQCEEVTCPPGEEWSDCAFNCDNVCDAFRKELQAENACLRNEKCVPGCTKKTCELPYFIRDAETCVLPDMCTCSLLSGQILSPGQVIQNGCEKCQCLDNKLTCNSILECKSEIETTPATTATLPGIGTTLPVVCEEGWTNWFNLNTPDRSGETELLDDIKDAGYVFCEKGEIADVECRNADTLQPVEGEDPNVQCDLNYGGLVCRPGGVKGNRPCSDYEIRGYCRCARVTPTPRVATLPGGYCEGGWTEWVNLNTPDEMGDKESIQQAREAGYDLCNREDMSVIGIECRNAETLEEVQFTGQFNTFCDLERGGLECDNRNQPKGYRCPDYEFRLECQCEKVSVTGTGGVMFLKTTPSTTVKPGTEGPLPPVVVTPAGPCDDGWTKWANLFSPTKYGEQELVVDMEAQGHLPCALHQVTKIECRKASTWRTLEPGDVGYELCSQERLGIVCQNALQPKGHKCVDYEIRALCTCEALPPPVTPVAPLPEETASPNIEVVTVKTTPTEPPTVVTTHTTYTTTAPCSYWSDWINKSRPKRGKKYGDRENTLPFVLKQTSGFCLEGIVSEIECRDAESDKNYLETRQEKLICNLETGFICENRDQLNRRCHDYKIRYYCSCGEEIPVTIVTKPTIPTFVYPCTTFVPLIDGDPPLPDSNLKASGSSSSTEGPNAARINADKYTKGAWSPAVSNEKQFIEVDLGDLRAIYGVITKGKESSEEWVTSYKLLYSEDGDDYSYYQDEEGVVKVFNGNFDDSSEVRHLFGHPFEARLVRLEPLSWEGKIALRFDLLGCPEALPGGTTPIVPTAVTPTVQPEEVCEDPMGLENGLLFDSQLSASSFRDSSTSPDHARLGSDTSWTADELINDQYLQVDFMEPQTITGIVTKGRKKLPQWVTAYIVAYGNDGKIWSKIMNEDGNVKEFAANYDQESEVKNLFTAPVRARYLRIFPTKWKNWISMQLEVLGCYHPTVCREPMGLENGLIESHQLSASSEYDEYSGASNAKLSSSKPWIPAKRYGEFIQVDLLEPSEISGIITKGNPDVNEYVTSYEVVHSIDGIDWDKVGDGMEFPGNTDGNSAAINLFPEPITARYVKVIPKDFEEQISLRLELLGCYHPQECREPMGLESGVLSDGQITASSSADMQSTPSHARLNDFSGWSPSSFDQWPYLQVDFIEPRNVSAIVTKGRKDEAAWITEFKILISDKGDDWKILTDEKGDTIIFRGNDDKNSPVVNTFPGNVVARYFRVIPLEFEKAIGLRLELLGCYHPYVCQEPMGMENGAILSYQLSASSYLNSYVSPVGARIDSDTAWVAENTDDKQFIQVDFMTPVNITGVMTRGRNDAYQWVTTFTVDYSNDKAVWTDVVHPLSGEIDIFKGNYDSDSQVTNLFPKPIFARYIRIKPLEYESWISMRFEILGCFEEHVCMEPMGLENGLLSDSQVTASSYQSEEVSPSNARLNSDTGWVANAVTDSEYLQIDFGGPQNISAIVTKGRADSDQWVAAYQVEYSNDGEYWVPVITPQGEEIEFPANSDSETPVINVFPEPIEAQFVRILPKDWHNSIGMRVEILGCYHYYEVTTPATLPTPRILDLTTLPTRPPIVMGCPDPMEVESSVLGDARITVSSSAPNSDATRIGLNTVEEDGLTGGWVPDVDDQEPYVKVELPENRVLIALFLKGREDKDNWVETLRLYASIDGDSWVQVFGPNGDAVIDGNVDQNSMTLHYFKKPVDAKFIKIVPETWHKWPSFRMDLRGCYKPEEPEKPGIVKPLRPRELCPELTEALATACPESCPPGMLCDGEQCVDPVDCVCVYNGHIFKVGDQVEDKSCKQCDCALGGRSVCSKKPCPDCPQGERSGYDENCKCTCERCDDNEEMCPTSGVCIPKVRWCDGIIDCPDDEKDCPSTTLTVPTEPPPPPGVAKCDIIGKHIKTLDGQNINYEICHHVALKDIENGSFNITIHKECDKTGKCRRWLQVLHEGHIIKVLDRLRVEYDGHIYTAPQLALLSKKPYVRLTIEKVGDQVVIKSLVYDFTIEYDVRGHLNIEVLPSMLRKVAGLCGFYSGITDDDQQKPDGNLAFTSREFGDSWSVGDEECEVPTCPLDVKTKAIELCNQLKEEPFAKCSSFVPIQLYIEICISSTCDCMMRGETSDSKCKCDTFQPFVEACEAKLGPNSVKTWRIKHDCIPDCPPGFEWDDCGPSCQLTCDSTSVASIEECSSRCVPGCFCPPGTVLNGEVCIPPDKCTDSICQGFGDPHFETFDGLFFPFQAIGTFLISADEERNYVIKGLTQKCHFLTPITCVVGLEISYGDSQVRIRKGEELVVGGEAVSMDELPLHVNNMVILGYPGRTFVVVIPSLSIEARFYEENAGFAVKVPSKRFFNQTVGLCGNCNKKKDDEVKEGSMKEFVCSWQTDGDEGDCKESFNELPESVDRVDLCEKLNHPLFEACYPLVDPNVYIEACSFDATRSNNAKMALCKTAMEYSRQCCQIGLATNGWDEEFDCEIDCPEDFHYESCHEGCPQTCETLKNTSKNKSCETLKLDGCFCPHGKVLKGEICVDELLCNTCDDKGHVPGDKWTDGACKTCECRENLAIECTMEVCPATPLCSKDDTLLKLHPDNEETTCCETFTCVPAQLKECPPLEIPTCQKGEVAKVQNADDLCPEYKCECDPIKCPDVLTPEDLEIGQVANRVKDGCCQKLQIECNPSHCPFEPICPEELELVEIPGECCTTYKCKPPKDVCLYKLLFEIVNGLEVSIPPEEIKPTKFKVGEEWQNGLCENCSCVENNGQLVPQCVKEHCPDVYTLPENKNYVIYDVRSLGRCCPEPFRIQCKDAYGNIYEAGEEWPDNDNPCINYLCELGDTGVEISKRLINCTQCPRTAEYIPPSVKLGQCCGFCRPSKCEHGDELYNVGDKWIPPDDPCTEAECESHFGKIQAVYSRQSCPVLPSDCPKEKIIRDEKGCCDICNLTSELSCNSAPIPVEETVNYFAFNELRHGGKCVNDKPVTGVLECKGACHSQSYYSLEDGNFKSMCKCCKVNITVERVVDLKCPDGSEIQRKFLQPETCQCSKCAPKTDDRGFVREKETYRPSIKGGGRRVGQEPVDVFQQEQGEFGQEPIGQWEHEDSHRVQEPFEPDFGQEPIGQWEDEDSGRIQKPFEPDFGQEPIGQWEDEDQESFNPRMDFGQEPVGDDRWENHQQGEDFERVKEPYEPDYVQQQQGDYFDV